MYRNVGAGTTLNLNHARSNVARASHQFKKQLVGSHSGGEWLSREVHRFRPPGGPLPIPFADTAAGKRHVPRSALRAAPFLARWSFHTPRQQAGQASASEPPPPE